MLDDDECCACSKTETTRFVDVGLVRFVFVAEVAFSRVSIVLFTTITERTVASFSNAR